MAFLRPIAKCLVLSWVIVLLGCSEAIPRFTTRARVEEKPPSTAVYQLEGIASYYADEFHGRKTSSGEEYDMHALTAAHRTLPFNTRVRVTNLENRKSVVLRINDRGPFKDDRVIDVSLEAAKQLGLVAGGTAPVKIEILELGNGIE